MTISTAPLQMSRSAACNLLTLVLGSSQLLFGAVDAIQLTASAGSGGSGSGGSAWPKCSCSCCITQIDTPARWQWSLSTATAGADQPAYGCAPIFYSQPFPQEGYSSCESVVRTEGHYCEREPNVTEQFSRGAQVDMARFCFYECMPAVSNPAEAGVGTDCLPASPTALSAAYNITVTTPTPAADLTTTIDAQFAAMHDGGEFADSVGLTIGTLPAQIASETYKALDTLGVRAHERWDKVESRLSAVTTPDHERVSGLLQDVIPSTGS
mmetsp:Transcript_22643/g.52832  ORF Transcript_22643/g.52832 Transcript_22643/m.52832 type:complete len:268 (+) Transcript_22643:153-956(+)|eukprot:CAMPEP_0178452512 /NCGR_PEP_ID=MMETSP0689_2-20121128/44287_1 /TAXON_ID=160604 /ORGANISM="Amphidinium massartii, Strain CS-259" /LENGTH=267 /DNA_ID=CAMNT_0020078229 /DNA_START=45 /DNA_END=848 /DNA_ORIENTATION=+